LGAWDVKRSITMSPSDVSSKTAILSLHIYIFIYDIYIEIYLIIYTVYILYLL
jgi:hypothetical protein